MIRGGGDDGGIRRRSFKTIVGIALGGCGGLMDGCGRAARRQERYSDTRC